jgi:hypothetical protein
MEVKQVFETLTPYDNFLYALKAKETRRQYPHRLDKFLSYLGLEGSIKEKCATLYKIGKDINLLETHIIRFISSQKERIQNKEISEGTLCNYIKALKLFCSMNDIMINWRKIIPYSIQMLKRRKSEWFREDLGILLNLLKHEKIKPIIAARMPLNEAARAHELLGTGSVTDKIVLICN